MYQRLKKLIEEGNLGGLCNDVIELLQYLPSIIDPLILPAVEILNAHGFKTFESCQGGEGHCYAEPTVRFLGSEPELLKAFEICQLYGLMAFNARRVWQKDDVYLNQGVGEGSEMPIGVAWGVPFNEITFLIHSKTGTIFLPC